ncbi:MAG: LamG domain-containing protein [Candidatus Poribacteria bacterium]
MFNKTLSLFGILAIIGFAFMLSSPIQAQQVIKDGLVSYWTFNKADVNGEIAKDVVGKNNGTIKGCKQVAGKYGEALEFDGAANYVEVPDDKSIDLWEKYTLEAWIFQTESRSSRIIDKITAGTADGMHLDTHPGTNLRSCAGACVSTGKTYSLNEWHHAVMTFDQGNVVLYIDGSAEGEGKAGSPLAGNKLSLKVGADSDGKNLFKGIIDEVRVYNRALKADEVKLNMKASSLAVDRPGKLSTTWAEVKKVISDQ